MLLKRDRDDLHAATHAGKAFIRFDGIEEQIDDDLLKFKRCVEMDDVRMRIVVEYDTDTFFICLIVSELNGMAHSLRERK